MCFSTLLTVVAATITKSLESWASLWTFMERKSFNRTVFHLCIIKYTACAKRCICRTTLHFPIHLFLQLFHHSLTTACVYSDWCSPLQREKRNILKNLLIKNWWSAVSITALRYVILQKTGQQTLIEMGFLRSLHFIFPWVKLRMFLPQQTKCFT